MFCFGTHIPRMLLLFLCVCVCVRTFRQRNTYVSNFRQSRPRQPLPLNGVSISSCFVFLSLVVKMYIVSFLLQSELTILTYLLRLPSVLFVNWPLERWQWWSALEQIHSKTLWHLTFTISIRGRKTKKCRLVKMKRNEEQLSFHFWCRLHIPDQMNHRRIEYTCRHPDDSRRLGFRVSLPKGGVLNEEGLSRRVAEEMFSNKSRDNVMKWRGEKQERAIHTLRVSMMWCWRTRNLWRLLCLVSKSLTFSGFKFRSRHRAHTRSSELKEIYGRVKRIKRK